MSTIYDNWERLVRAVLKREEIWEICHAPSRSSSPNSTSSDSNSSLTIHFDDHNLIIISPRAEVEESAYQSESEWVEEYEAGVQITFAASIDGNIGVKRASFSLGRFKKHEAIAWWVKNQDKVHENYNIQARLFLGKSEENTRPKRNENALSKNDSEENLRSKDLEAGGSDDQFVDHRTWIELYEPGICVTLGDFGDGTIYLKRIHFSRRRFEEHEADTWWLTNRDKVYEKYNIEQAALVPNAPQRFWYTLDLKKEEERKQLIAKTSTQAQVIRAAVLFQEAGQGLNVPEASKFPSRPTRIQDFGISSEELVEMARELDVSLLQQNGGVTGLAPKLKSNLEKGVPGDETDLIKRKIAFGSNAYPRKKGRSFWRFVLEACRGTTLIVLMVAAVASLVLGIKTEGIKEGWYYGGSISLAVLIVIIFTAASDYKQSLQFQNLNEEKQNIQTEVIRSGRRIKVSIFEIVVGDVVPLKIGHQVPADGLVISGHSLLMDESSITGDCKLVHKDSTSAPFLMSGCKVADGYGTMLVTSVGINTEWGLLMASISEDNDNETPLQVRLNGVANLIGIVGLAVAVVVLVVLGVRFFTGHTKDPDGRVQFSAGKTKVGDAIDGFIKIFTIAVTIVVVAVPESLPLAVTLTLAYSMRKMMADRALVRRLSACETMGSATTICSDKTGILTLNQMTVVEAYACGKKIDPPGNKSLLAPTVLSLLIEGVAQNFTGSVFVPGDSGAPEVSGSPTEEAILLWGANLGMDFEAVRSDSIIIHAFPFNSEIKQGGVALKLSDSEVHVHWQGAAEIVLASCTSYIDENDCVVHMDAHKLSFFNKAIEDMAAGSLRCVALAYRLYETEKVPTSDKELAYWQLPREDLILLAIVGIKDPCRPGVRHAVQLCSNAGVKVRMVTGDNLLTARAIALECGILQSNADATEPNLIEGKAFRSLAETKRLEVADKISVMARSSPNDKLLLVQALRKRGHVVAVTGDGMRLILALQWAFKALKSPKRVQI